FKVVTSMTQDGYVAADQEVVIADADGGHGGADPLLIGEFLRFATEGGPTETSPVAARAAVAAGVLATESLRGDGAAREVPPLDEGLLRYFAANQERETADKFAL
ncbi:MAG: gfo/Idh/MocA family oxidoreductase, partial [Micrococcaceae bacterium]|nr:gfo/Idh/MocA family oxidoreductase [Micrococcaceae bacterium]